MSKKKSKKKGIVKTAVMVVKGVNVTVGSYQERDYINLNDIVSHIDGQRYHIEEWIRSKKTLDYLASWERKNNPNFDSEAYVKYIESIDNGKSSSVGRWVKSVNAIGLRAELGRSGGTYAHKHIAFKFAGYLDSDFELYLVEEFDRLKQDEAKRNNDKWDVGRELTRLNFRLMTDQIQCHLVDGLPKKIHGIIYAEEADYLNLVVYGQNHQEWKACHPEKIGNQRDHGTVLDNLILSGLELHNSAMINEGIPKQERWAKLRDMAYWQRAAYANNPGMNRLSKKYDVLENSDKD